MTESRTTRPNRSYELLPYDPQWAVRFREYAERLKPIFGDNCIAIEHIGSTSVPGMVAKPQIDVLVIVKDLAKVKEVYESMKALGYVCKGDFTKKNEEYFTLDGSDGHRLVSVHTMQHDNWEAKMYIDFRDFLRSHEEARNRYIAKKLELNQKFTSQDYNSYDFGKGELIAQLREEARAWAAAENR